MSGVSLSKLNWYPVIHPEDSLQTILNDRFCFTPEDIETLDSINYRPEEIAHISTRANAYLRYYSKELSKVHDLFLRFVKLSKYCPSYQHASSNAISILNEMGFSFSYLDLRGVQIREAKLAYAILHHTNLSGANVDGADLTNACLIGAQLEGGKDLKLGRQPCLRHAEEVLGVALSFDGRTIVSCDCEAFYQWDIQTRELLDKKPFPPGYTGKQEAGYSDRKPCQFFLTQDDFFLFVCFGNGDIDIWDRKVGEVVQSIKTSEIQLLAPSIYPSFSFAFTEDRHYLLVFGEDGSVTFWTVIIEANGRPHLDCRTCPSIGPVKLACLSSTEPYLLACSYDEKVTIFHLSDFQQVHQFEDLGPLSSLLFSLEGDKVIVTREYEILELNIKTKEKTSIFTLKEVQALTIKHTCWIPGSSILVYETSTGGHFEIHLYDLETNKSLGSVYVADFYGNASFLFASGDRLITAFHSDIHLLKATDVDLKELSLEIKEIGMPFFLPDRQSFYRLGKEAVCQYDVSRGQEVKRLSLIGFSYESFAKPYVVFSKDGFSLSIFETADDEYYESPDPERLKIIYTSLLKRRTNPWIQSLSYQAIDQARESQHIALVRDGRLEIWKSEQDQPIACLSLEKVLRSSSGPHSEYYKIEGFRVSPSIFPAGYLLMKVSVSIDMCEAGVLLESGVASEFQIWQVNFTTGSVERVPITLEDFERQGFLSQDEIWVSDWKGVTCIDLKTAQVRKPKLNLPEDQDEEECGEPGFSISEDGNSILSFRIDNSDERVITSFSIWDTHTGKKKASLEMDYPMAQFCLSPQVDLLFCWHEERVQMWEINEGCSRLLWTRPQILDTLNLQIHHPEKLDELSRRLFSQLSQIV